MSLFIGIALLFLAIAIAIVLRPLLKSDAGTGIGREQANLSIYRNQLEELEADVRAGSLSEDKAQQARLEIEDRVLEEASGGPARPQGRGRSLVMPSVIAVLIPALSAGLYFHLGTPEGLNAQPHAASDMSSITPSQFEEMTAKLAARMQEHPDDAVGWSMLGRAYRVMERNQDAADAFAKAVGLKPDDADLLADYAEALGMARERNLAGEPTKLLDRALKVDPDNGKALALSGSAAFDRKDYKAAIRHWETLLKQPGTEGELALALRTGIEDARRLAAGGKAQASAAAPAPGRITGVVHLAGGLRAQAGDNDVVFVFARAAAGPRMPLAIAKAKVSDLPYRFTLDDSMAMLPDMKISGFAEVVVGARISKSGSATPASGDLEGVGTPVRPGASGVNVTIDRVVQ